jgi:hypothetical protein
MVWEWTKNKGPLTDWYKCIMHELREAKRRGTMDRVAQDWRAHALVGKALLKDLASFVSSVWPKDEGKLQDLVRQAFELLQTLQGGITIIEVILGPLAEGGA